MNYKVDPDDITNFNLDQYGLELNILFWILAAGKNGHTSAVNLNKFLSHFSKLFNKISPFEIINHVDNLPESLKIFGIGCYNNKSKTIKELINKKLDLKNCTIKDLENIWGMGPKTIRCFFIHTRENQKFAGLDRHVLNFLKEEGYNVPKNSPNKKQYAQLEEVFLQIAEKLGKTPSELDLEIWKKKRILPKTLEKVS